MIYTLIDQYQAYLHLQGRIAKAIENRDESLLNQLREASTDLFLIIEANRKDLVEATDIKSIRETSFLSDSRHLVLLMERAQRQVQENETRLQSWLSQMKADIQQYRSSQPHRGVLASYLQQKQVASHGMIPTPNIPSVSTQDETVPVMTTPAQSPWTVPSRESETVGHRFHEQS
ncbi:hypothetical protein [Candidatus Nitronereus thalassa]|uniref:FlgN protein n=1 Tax=Candidatus Nitronereus thalassa TaxID=3020898 RepID=A0ABU3K668_9BACT|nr:hypothetical protein [Candidatus Nitronereus thalassa]MDT7041833.1 hypothetical protein [Candidatus Nitronereus thalassa]